MENNKDAAQVGTTGFYLSDENIKRLLLYVTAEKLKGEKTTRSGVVNLALDLFFQRPEVSEQLENIA